MAINGSREVVIEASPDEVLDVIADIEAMPEWSAAHQSAEVLETGDDGRPSRAKMKVKAVGITDEQVVAYTWTDNAVSWTLVSSSAQRSQNGKYELTRKGDSTVVKFEISVDLVIPLPGFMLKRAVNGSIETATEALRTRVLQVKKGKSAP